MRRGLSLAVALLVGASSYASAYAAPRPAHDRAASIARWEAGRAKLAGKLPLDPALKAAAFTYEDSRLFKAGDLDKDGGVDLVDARYHGSYDDATGLVTESMRLEAHRGRDGKPLWTAQLGSASYIFVIAAKVGATGAPGLVVLSYAGQDVDAQVGFADTDTLTVTALDGAGKQVWTRSFPGGYGFAPAGYVAGTTYVTGFFNAVKGGGDDLLVETVAAAQEWDPTGVTDVSGAVAQLTLVDGANGTPKPFGAPLANTASDVNVATTGDLNGDGLDDAAAVVTAGSTTSLLALSGGTGAPVWAARGLPAAEYSFPVAVPDSTGDGVADVVVARSPWGAGPVLAGYQGEQVSLVDGKAGTLRWTKPGGEVFPIGDVDRKPGAELALVAVVDGKDFGFTAAAYDAGGKALWSARRTVRPSSEASFGIMSVGFGPIGDVQDDGAVDLGYSVASVADKGPSVRDDGTVDGRTGRVIKDPVPDMYAAVASFDGHGTDSYTRTLDEGVLTVEARRGDTGARLWRTALAVRGHVMRAAAFTGDRDRCAELALATADGGTFVDYVLAGGSGAPLWALSRTGDGPATLTRAVVRSHAKYARTC
jgi:predicted lipoprotein with Yx(FWY)xxD motif